IRQLHQFTQLLGRKSTQALDQLLRVIKESGLRCELRGWRGFQVKTFCGRQHNQHKIQTSKTKNFDMIPVPPNISPKRIVIDTNVCLDLFVFQDPRWASLLAAIES